MVKKIKCLLVDDEQSFVNYLKILFELHGFNALASLSVDEALEILKREKVDFIITDLQMPEKDGFYLIDKITGEEKFNNIPVIVVSNNDSNTVINKALEKGVAGFIRKPFLENHINKIIELLSNETDESGKVVI